MKLIFEKSVPGRRCTILPPCDVDTVALPEELRRAEKPALPELSETDISRHYTSRFTASTAVSTPLAPVP